MAQSTSQAAINDLKVKRILCIVEFRKLRNSLQTVGNKAVAYINSVHHDLYTKSEKVTAEQKLEKDLHALEPAIVVKPSFFNRVLQKLESFFK